MEQFRCSEGKELRMWGMSRDVKIAQLRVEDARIVPIVRDSRLGGEEAHALKGSKSERDTGQAGIRENTPYGIFTLSWGANSCLRKSDITVS